MRINSIGVMPQNNITNSQTNRNVAFGNSTVDFTKEVLLKVSQNGNQKAPNYLKITAEAVTARVEKLWGQLQAFVASDNNKLVNINFGVIDPPDNIGSVITTISPSNEGRKIIDSPRVRDAIRQQLGYPQYVTHHTSSDSGDAFLTSVKTKADKLTKELS